jgi:uncharacterized phosphosugar-binding protein
MERPLSAATVTHALKVGKWTAPALDYEQVIISRGNGTDAVYERYDVIARNRSDDGNDGLHLNK